MPKSKQFARPPKKQKAKGAIDPQSAEDFQEAADLEEATAGKWRAGDSAKSGRAFVRALDIYDNALQRYPTNFDLAYNKARLQLEITQQPAIVAHIGLPPDLLLKQCLDSHRFALRLNAEIPDILFNTAQVLASLAEALIEEDATEEPIPLLHEALELFSSCLSRQEMLFEQQIAAEAEFRDQVDENDGGVRLDATNAQGENESSKLATLESNMTDSDDGEAATVEMPITYGDLLDTIHASCATLTTLVPLLDQHALQNIASMAQTLTEEKAPTYVAQLPTDDRPQAELMVNLDRAVFVAALADAQYNYQTIDLDTYVSHLTCFDFKDKEQDDSALSAEGDARQELAFSVLTSFADSPDMPAEVCWRQLSLAQEAYAKAAKLDSSTEVYLSRGDVEMCRHRLSTFEHVQLSPAVRKSAPTLMQNAQTFYRSASKLVDTADVEMKSKIERRILVATALRTVLYEVESPTESAQLQSNLKAGLIECVEDDILSASVADLVASRLGMV